MNSTTNWQRCNKRHPCPVCGKPDWCLYAGEPGNPTAAICARVESPKRCGEAGWLHVLRDDGPTWAPWRRTIRRAVKMMDGAKPGDIDFGALAATFRQAVEPDALGRLAGNLGLTADSLARLGIGWSQEHRAWTFPMTDVVGNVLGIRLRLSNGRKLAVRGGREGLFVPEGIDAGGLLLIAEGPTDAAALLDLGLAAIGRPNCTGGVKLLVAFCRQRQPTEVVIVADGDGPGRRGAGNLAVVLIAYCQQVRIITPPAGVKDARAWKQGGATRQDVESVIDVAPVRRLPIRVQRKAGRKTCKILTD